MEINEGNISGLSKTITDNIDAIQITLKFTEKVIAYYQTENNQCSEHSDEIDEDEMNSEGFSLEDFPYEEEKNIYEGEVLIIDESEISPKSFVLLLENFYDDDNFDDKSWYTFTQDYLSSCGDAGVMESFGVQGYKGSSGNIFLIKKQIESELTLDRGANVVSALCIKENKEEEWEFEIYPKTITTTIIAGGVEAKQEVVQLSKDSLRSYKRTYVDGSLEFGHFDSNEDLHGSSKSYFSEDILMSEGSFRHGHRIGEWIGYHPNGKLRKKLVFDNDGQVISTLSWDEYGNNLDSKKIDENTGLINQLMSEMKDRFSEVSCNEAVYDVTLMGLTYEDEEGKTYSCSELIIIPQEKDGEDLLPLDGEIFLDIMVAETSSGNIVEITDYPAPEDGTSQTSHNSFGDLSWDELESLLNQMKSVSYKSLSDVEKFDFRIINIMNSIESDIYGAIDMAFGWFKKNNPTLEVICDEETMTQWYDFVKWCYAQDGEDSAEGEIKENPSFNFKISPLMENAMNECAKWWHKYNLDHQQIAEEDFKESCGNCDGAGYMDEDCENECETCEASGYDPEDEDGHWFYYEEAFSKISNSVNTSCFEKLSSIGL
tara:strand:- start:1530 stop:3329 length:1800 start_codon:yes stop_codon:yes gene_type:complete